MKQQAVYNIQTAIRTIINGGIYVSEEMHRLILESINSNSFVHNPISSLTSKELEVMRLIGQGLGTREISKKLNRSVKTIETHRCNIKVKLSIKSGTELIRFAAVWDKESR
jgi:DNA-binding NarL/FixJ family response regulator